MTAPESITVRKARIKDIREFSRLFGIKIPWQPAFEYYIQTLSQSKEFEGLDALVEEFARFESDIQPEPIGDYKMGMLRQIRDRVLQSTCFKTFKKHPLSAHKTTLDNLFSHDDHVLATIDIRRANHSILKCFDEEQEFPESWEGLCDQFEMHPLLKQSKSFRQLVFGNLDPKRAQSFQHMFIHYMLQYLEQHGWHKNRLILRQADEVILKLSKNEAESKRQFEALGQLVANLQSATPPPDIPPLFHQKIKLRTKAFRLEHIGKKSYLKQGLIPDGQGFKKGVCSLHGVPGNQFYLFFKTYILNQPHETTDLLFQVDHHLAKWVVPEPDVKFL